MVLLCLWTPGIGPLPQVRRCSSSVPDCYVAFPPLVGFAFGLSAVPLPQAAAVALACVGLHGCPPFSRVGVDPSPWIPFLWPG